MADSKVIGVSCWKCSGCGRQLAMPIDEKKRFLLYPNSNTIPLPPDGAKHCECGKPWIYVKTVPA